MYKCLTLSIKCILLRLWFYDLVSMFSLVVSDCSFSLGPIARTILVCMNRLRSPGESWAGGLPNPLVRLRMRWGCHIQSLNGNDNFLYSWFRIFHGSLESLDGFLLFISCFLKIFLIYDALKSFVSWFEFVKGLEDFNVWWFRGLIEIC